MKRRTLAEYRAAPSDQRFARVWRAYSAWLKSIGMGLVKMYPGLGVQDAQDLVNEGLWRISVSARRYVYVCASCRDCYVDAEDLRSHALGAHRTRGSADSLSLVSLCGFVEQSARLAMKRSANRLNEIRMRDVPEMEDRHAPSVESPEDRILMELVLRRADAYLTREARSILRRVMQTDRPRVAELTQVRAEFACLMGV